MNRSTQIAITTAVIALALLVVVTFLWVKDEQRLHTGVGNISATRDQIRADCARTDVAGKNACAQDLQDLSDMLASLKTGAPSTAVPAQTGPATGNTNAGASLQFAPSNVQVQTVPLK